MALTREVANELVMSAVLLPMAIVELNAEFHGEIFATDASMGGGAIVAAPTSSLLSEVLWRSCKSKGAYTRLQSVEKKVFEKLGLDNEVDQIYDPWRTRVRKPLAFKFEFIEVFSGAGKVPHYVQSLGFSVGPPSDLSNSRQFWACTTFVERSRAFQCPC